MSAVGTETGGALFELKFYRIFEANKAAFHDRFRDHAARIMRRYGFDIVGMWEAMGEAGPEFVYMPRWRDEGAMAAGWDRFMADAEWARIKTETTAEHGELFADVRHRVMRRTAYSPQM